MCGPGMVAGLFILSLPVAFIVWATHQFGITGFIASACLVGAAGIKIHKAHVEMEKEINDGNHRD